MVHSIFSFSSDVFHNGHFQVDIGSSESVPVYSLYVCDTYGVTYTFKLSIPHTSHTH